MRHPMFHSTARVAASPSWPVLAAMGWLLFGAFLLALTPLPAHTAQLGWSPVFWLLLAPACLLLGSWLRPTVARR